MLLRSGETHLKSENLAAEIAQTYNEEDYSPFPYEGCRWLRREFDGELEYLIPHLDLWLSDIAGFASRGKRLLNFSEEEVSHASGLMSLSFFEKHPEYSWLERHITESETPDLYEKIDLYESMRTMLIALFDLMLREECQE